MQAEFSRTLLKTMMSDNIEGRFDEPMRLRDLILHYDRTSAINAILSIMKAFKYVRFSATLTLPVDTLMASMMRMNVLSVCIGILLIGWGVTMNMIVGYELNNYRSFMESVLTLVKVIFGEADFGELMEVRSPRFEMLRCLHAIDATRGRRRRGRIDGVFVRPFHTGDAERDGARREEEAPRHEVEVLGRLRREF